MSAIITALAIVAPAAEKPETHLPKEGSRTEHRGRCLTKACWRRVHRKRAANWARRHPWRVAWARLSSADKAWAVNTGRCESGNNTHAHNPSGIYHGEHQWLLATWHAAGGSGDPHAVGRKEQRVRAVRWRNKAGGSQWPVCNGG